MAFAATHMRFALDLKDEYRVRDVKKYIAGTIYPDSRYVTGLDRNLTHGEDMLKPAFARDDFRKGWQVHELCDMVQYFLFTKTVPALAGYSVSGWPEDKWLDFTAAKIVEDVEDAQKYDIEFCLSCLDYAANPNGENIEDVKRYNRAVIACYHRKSAVTPGDIYEFWTGLGLGRELGGKIKRRTEKLLQDAESVAAIGAIYDRIIASYGAYQGYYENRVSGDDT